MEKPTVLFLLVTSSVPGEGKTTVAVNLAEAFAKKKYRVVLLDGDLRNPSVLKCIGLSEAEGTWNHRSAERTDQPG